VQSIFCKNKNYLLQHRWAPTNVYASYLKHHHVTIKFGGEDNALKTFAMSPSWFDTSIARSGFIGKPTHSPFMQPLLVLIIATMLGHFVSVQKEAWKTMQVYQEGRVSLVNKTMSRNERLVDHIFKTFLDTRDCV